MQISLQMPQYFFETVLFPDTENIINYPNYLQSNIQITNSKITIRSQHLSQMLNNYISFLVLFTLFHLTSSFSKKQQKQQKVITMPLNNQWQFKILDAPKQKSDIIDKKYKTNLPSNLYLDLMNNQIIDDPFHRNNFQKVTWVSKCTVKYTKQFIIQQKNRNRVTQIIFNGIDTYANITLNNHLILQTNNAYKIYTVPITQYLHKQKQSNILQITIQSSQNYEIIQQSINKMQFKYAHSRKPCYQYSWDWAPQLINIGIWKSIQLRFYDQIRIDYVWVRNKIISQPQAVLNFAIKMETHLQRNQHIIKSMYSIQVYNKGIKLGTAAVNSDTVYLDISIINPHFWWPNGIGQPFMYNFIVLLMKNGQKIDYQYIQYGIRTVQLNLEDKKFQVKVNGYPIYCKGANYVPMDIFSSRLINQHYKNKTIYTPQKLLNDAVQSNFNMIRIWGGGQYQSQQFLTLASRKGIMIFYDFMFSSSNYPVTPQFLDNVQQQIKQQVRLTRNFPAVVLWNGNNQILQKLQQRGQKNEKNIADFDKLFNILIKNIVNIENPFIPYIQSSPIYGSGSKSIEKGGDVHLWGVWGGQDTFEKLQTTIGPFTTQFGMQGMPVWHTIKQFTNQDQRIYDSSILESHQRHFSKFTLIRKYMEQYMNNSTNFYQEVYLTGLLQAYAIQKGVIAQRSAKPLSYGTLYWQMNDAWPSISFSSIDYYGRWKPLQYLVKRLYTNIAIFTLSNNTIVAINDNLNQAEASVKIVLMYFNGTIIFKQQKYIKLLPDSVTQITTIPAQHLTSNLDKIVCFTQIYANHMIQMRHTKYFVKPKQLKLQKSKLKVTYAMNQNYMTFESKKLIKNLFIDHAEKYIHFSQNYFDVVPGFPVVVKLPTSQSLKLIRKKLQFVSLRDVSLPDQDLEVQLG